MPTIRMEEYCIHGIDIYSDTVDCLECRKLVDYLEELDERGQFTAVVLPKRPEPDQ